jgi:predicted dinucleotide-utilizing enzyme
MMDASVAKRRRIGLIGFGVIGRQVFARVQSDRSYGLDVAFVHNRSPRSLSDVPPQLRLERLEDFKARGADLVIEMAHPRYSAEWGEQLLSVADYLPLSVTALADDDLRSRLLARARASGTCLAIPHGALIGLDNLREWRHAWTDVEITFRKHPANIDFSESGIDPASINGETILYDGPVRGIARLYPRNVNTMVTCALATIGLDRCRARFIASRALTVAIAEVSATGRDGSVLTMRREQPAVGVSGTEMFESQFASILRLAGHREALMFV